jgi:uncharacterized membrane protein
MLDTRIILSGLWVATMLTYLWGDVLRIMAGDAEKTLAEQAQLTQVMWLGIAVLMLIPIVMVVLTLTLKYPAIRWANIIVAIFWVVFNLFGLSGYPTYNKFILIISFVFNAMTVWYAWKWVA